MCKMLSFLYFFLVTLLAPAATIPSTYKTLQAPSPTKHAISITSHGNNSPVLSTIEISPKTSLRKKKGPNIPLSFQHHQLLVPNLHVIPIQHHIHTDFHHIIGDNKVTIINQNAHGANNSHTYIPVLVPIHNLIPVHELTVIPLHRVDTKISFNEDDERERYRTPLGGYGIGWGYGGHGAGHGFHYAYG